MATPSGNRNGSNSHNHLANVVKTIIFIGLVALFQIKVFGTYYSDGYTKGLRRGEVHAIHSVEDVSKNAYTGSSNNEVGGEKVREHGSTEILNSPPSASDESTALSEDDHTVLDPIEVVRSSSISTGEISIPEIVEKNTDIQTYELEEGTTISMSSSTSTEKSSKSLFNGTETQRGSNEQNRNSTNEEVPYSSLSIETEIIPVSSSNDTGTQLEIDKQQDDESEVEGLSLPKFIPATGTATASSSNETMTGWSKLTSSGNDRNVTSGTYRYNSSVTVPILSINSTSEVKTNTGFEKPNPGSVIARNETESSASFEPNSTDSATKIVGLDVDNTNNSDPTSFQKNRTGLATKIVWPDTTNTNTSNGITTSVKATGNGTSFTVTVSNRTESEDDLSPDDKQYALWSSTRETFYETKPWQNSSTFTTVDRDVYQQLVKKAQASVKSIVEGVYTDCEMYILPTISEAGDIQSETPRIQYKCLGDDNPILQDDLCRTVNMCRVIMDEEAWNAVGASGANITNSTIDSTISPDKSTLLMIVDSVEYMMKPETFNGVMNKASYAYRSNRPLYIWIGNLDEDELNRREIESFAPTFGFRCTEKELKNSMHFYKPIAFLTLFDILASSSLSSRSIFYLDADTAFTATAFERIENDKFHDKSSNRENLLGPIGPESFLGLSPQASLMATQNIKGKMLMNSGVMLLRDTRWSRDFLALWWHGRCGSKDQLTLWLVLYATFSAWTAGGESSVSVEGGTQFTYPGDVFFDYSAANQKLFMHFRANVHSLQAAWEVVVEQRRNEQNLTGIERNDEDEYDYPAPTNTKLYNGGSQNLGPKLFGPMELPHVVILSPMRPVSYNKTIQNASEDGTPGLTVQVHLPRLKSEGDDSLVVHSKTIDGCSNFRCWPYK